MRKGQSCRYVEVSRTKAKPAATNPYWPLAAGVIVLVLAMALVKHSGWRGHRSPVTNFKIQFQYMNEISDDFQKQYKSAIAHVCSKWRAENQTQSLRTLQKELMELGHFQSARVSMTAPQMIHISVLTGERLFDVSPSLLARLDASTDFKAMGRVPLPSETEALSLPVLDVSTSSGLSTAIQVFKHAKLHGWSSFIDEIREPKPNQIELIVTDGSGTQGLIDFRSTPSHEAGTEPVFTLKLKILDRQAMVYRSLTPGGGHWRIEPRGMVRRPAA